MIPRWFARLMEHGPRELFRPLYTKPVPPPAPVAPPPGETPTQRTVRLNAEGRKAMGRRENARLSKLVQQAQRRAMQLYDQALVERRRTEIERQRIEAVKRGEIYEEPKRDDRSYLPHHQSPVYGTGMHDSYYGMGLFGGSGAVHVHHHHH